ncbi:hypothetical protein EVAR_67897_1 [Eumeta japonica]|uniref:Uncharacterized protein n=1 Tax=Eumeta variegata TaxID=151549 RepID=A0A4C1YWC0_EUMVA|nr:hypothetical protein EVAR_67897_1 [Eumeta japonica]
MELIIVNFGRRDTPSSRYSILERRERLDTLAKFAFLFRFDETPRPRTTRDVPMFYFKMDFIGEVGGSLIGADERYLHIRDKPFRNPSGQTSMCCHGEQLPSLVL